MADETTDRVPILIGCLTSAGCGLVLLIGGVAMSLFYATSEGGDLSGPVATPTSPTFPTPPPVVPPTPPTMPPSPPGMPLPPPPALPPIVPPAPPGTLAPPTDTSPRRVRATVTEASGARAPSVGTVCAFEVNRVGSPDGSFLCNAQITCGSTLLYGGATAGFFPCTLYAGTPRHVVGADQQTTVQDGDGAMSLDTHGTLEIWDDATGTNGELRVRARVDAVE